MIKLQLRRLKPEIVIGCMATKYGFYTSVAKNRPTLAIIWGTDVLIAPKRHLFFRFLAKHTLKKADAVILDSQVQEKAAIQLGCNPNKILKFPQFDIESIKPRKSRHQIRRELNWQNNTIVYCARSHEPTYRVQDLIEAVPQILQKQPNTRFLILGKGSQTPMLKQRTKELDVVQHTRFIGAVSRQEAMDYLNASDLYVSTSISDGTSASLLEAMTLGIPVVVTGIQGNKEWIANNENGALTPARDPKSLAQRIIELIENKEAARELARNAKKTTQQKVDWQKNMRRLDNLIQQLASKEV